MEIADSMHEIIDLTEDEDISDDEDQMQIRNLVQENVTTIRKGTRDRRLNLKEDYIYYDTNDFAWFLGVVV